MCPSTPIEFASVYDTEIGYDGQMYMAQYVDGLLCWVCLDGVSFSQSEEAPKSGRSKQRQRQRQKQNTCNKYPSIPLECATVNEVYVGEDGNAYIAKMVKGRMSWSAHTKSHDWNSTTITTITITSDDLNTCFDANDKSMSKKSRKRPSKKV
jgi:hypothetical protein